MCGCDAAEGDEAIPNVLSYICLHAETITVQTIWSWTAVFDGKPTNDMPSLEICIFNKRFLTVFGLIMTLTSDLKI